MGETYFKMDSSGFGSLDRVTVRELIIQDREYVIDNYILVTFYTMEEIFIQYPNHYFDKYGNLVLRSTPPFCAEPVDGEHITHLAPAHFKDLGTTHHIHKGCGYVLEKTFIKTIREKN